MTRPNNPQSTGDERKSARGTTNMDQDTQRRMEADEGSDAEAMEAARSADRDVQSGGRDSTGSGNRQTEGTDQGSNSRGE